MASLSDYEKKRDFRKTSEPKGGTRKRRGDPVFVVQKHDARSLHYDFRLEHDGVLKSWAVPKGPSTDPGDKRLAVQVEDHPLDYADFEGIIPKGEYGGGTVLLWDRGTWAPEEESKDLDKALEGGSLKFVLHGEKLTGSWALVKMKGRGDHNWLLIKHRDRSASPDQKSTIVDRQPKSVASNRSIKEIAASPDAVWSDGIGPTKIEGATSGNPMPAEFAPELATLVDSLPTSATGWFYEIKYDGYRLIARKEGDLIRLLTRNGKDWTQKFPKTAQALKGLAAEEAVLDGELCALDSKGVSRFQRLQGALRDDKTDALAYFAFDLLWCDGHDLRPATLRDRKRALADLLERSSLPGGGSIRYSDHLEEDGEAFHQHACATKLEGIICKKASSRYHGKRTRDWLKVKCGNRQEFVIGGFTEPAGSRIGFGALLVGVRENGRLRYCGRVGTGFTDRLLHDLHSRLAKLERKTPPFAQPPSGPGARGVTWVNPELVGEVSFTEWTDDGHLRHPAFLGLREDKDSAEVRPEIPEKPKTKAKTKTKATANSKTKPKTKVKARGGGGDAGGNSGDQVCGVTISSPDRVVFPEAGTTKVEVAAYYGEIAGLLLDYAGGRPLSVVRCPSGRQKSCFYQKHRAEGMPEAVGSVRVGESDYLTVESAEGVVALVQFGVLEIHPWLSRNDDLDRPDRMVFDLDPDKGVEWAEILGAAYLLRDTLAGLELECFPMLTGGKGVHVIAPLTRRATFDTIKPAAKAIAERVRDLNPDKFLTVANKKKRRGKIFIDYLRNGRGATSVAAYSLRARPGAPVAVPLSWREVVPSLPADHYTIESVRRRLASLKNPPWPGFATLRQSLTKAALKDLGVS
ncbi:DNA ligase D [soil metagenome]